MKKYIKIIMSIVVFTMLVVACKKDKPVPTSPPVENPEELITTCKVQFTDPNGVNPSVEAIFKDLDGPGGNAPSSFDTIRLLPNAVYNAYVLLLNESNGANDNISVEVLAEGSDHLFCFGPDASLNLGIIKTDSDGTYEIGLQSQWTTGNASVGNTLIRLKHQPGIKDGTCEPGATDLELSFVTEIN